MRIVALFLIAALAGCVADEPTPDTTPAADEPAPTTSLSLFLWPDGSLRQDAPDAASMTMDWGYAQWLDGTPAPAWDGPAGPWHIMSGNLTLWYEATKPSTGADVRPELTAWWGSDHSVVHHVFVDGPDAVAAGDVIEAQSELRIPDGGLVIGPDRHMQLRVGTYYADGPDADVMDLLMGGETPSRLELEVRPIEWPSVSGQVVVDETVQAIGGRCTIDANPEGSAEQFITMDVPADAQGITVSVQQVGGGPGRDVDFSLKGPGGEDMGGGHGSFDVEGAHAWWPNLQIAGPGTYTIHVYACTAQLSDIHVQATLYR